MWMFNKDRERARLPETPSELELTPDPHPINTE